MTMAICDKEKVPLKRKGTFYPIAIRLAVLCGMLGSKKPREQTRYRDDNAVLDKWTY